MDELNNPQPTPPSGYNGLTGKEKLGFLGLVVLALLVIILGFRQTQSNLKSPFNDFITKYTGSTDTEANNIEVASMDVLKTKDTDKDGLSDYDELYTYRTSPYLADSDSDGITDKTEVTQGADPNCPVGQNCGAYTLANPDITGNGASTTLNAGNVAMPTSDQLLLQSLFGNNPDPKSLRDFLLKQGMDKALLDKLTDAEIVQVFQESIKPGNEATTVPGSQPQTLSDISKMTPQDIRKLLLQQGMTEAQLKNITDVQLMKMLQDSLK
jgi:hypothetical protein